eukprot:PhM_4_TR4031/c0_g1_i1/m.89696
MSDDGTVVYTPSSEQLRDRFSLPEIHLTSYSILPAAMPMQKPDGAMLVPPIPGAHRNDEIEAARTLELRLEEEYESAIALAVAAEQQESSTTGLSTHHNNMNGDNHEDDDGVITKATDRYKNDNDDDGGNTRNGYGGEGESEGGDGNGGGVVVYPLDYTFAILSTCESRLDFRMKILRAYM